jgi:hypothetical protein
MIIALLWLASSTFAQAAGLQVLHGHVPAATGRLHALHRLTSTNRLDLAIGLNLRNQAALTNLLRELYDPASPNYHQYLTPDQFADTFGPTKQDYDAVIAFATANGLKVTGKHPNRTLLDVSGSVAAVEKALHVKMLVYQHPDESRTFYAPDVEPSLDLVVPVVRIGGLDNYRLPHPANLKVRPDRNDRGNPSGGPQTNAGSANGIDPWQVAGAPSEASPIPNAGSGPGGTYQGNDFRTAYVPGVSLTGSGQALGLLELDGYYTNDITAYENRGGLPNVLVTNVLLNDFLGAPGAKNYEVALDIEMAIAMAPGLAEVIVYEGGPQASAYSVLNHMATDNLARQLSSSWLWGPGDDPLSDQIFQQFAVQGQSFFNAAGDVDAYTNAIPFPADNPYLTVVGATSLTTTTNGAWSSETVWNSGNGQGDSGGISPTYVIPTWQQGINMSTNGGSTTNRNLPDVAMVGANVSAVWNNGQTNTFYGTSISAPLWAALMALVNQQAANYSRPPAGFINPAIYGLGQSTNYQSCFHDITTGNNTKNTSPSRFFAVHGYDLCTGWGTPAGQALIDALEPPTYLVISPSAGLTAGGLPSGPFSPSAQNLILSNLGPATLSWLLASRPSWLSITPTNGTLPPGGPAAVVSVGFASAASALTSAVYSASVAFTDGTTHLTQTVPFTLEVSASLVKNGGFEAGSFTNWSLTGDTNLSFVSASQITPHSGNYCAVFGQYGSLAYLSQTVPTSPGQAYLLGFWLPNPTGATPTQFLVNWIASPANTNNLLNLTNLSAFNWTNIQFVVVATGTNSILQFGFRDDPQYLGLDDVSLTAVPTPVLTTAAPTHGTLAFSWTSFPGLKYQVQCTTNLTQAIWSNLGMPITASNTAGAATVTNGAGSQRFYRILGPQ